MKRTDMLVLPVVILFSMGAYAQQTSMAPPQTSGPAGASVSMPKDCEKMMDKMASADKAAMPMKADDCEKTAASDAAAKKKAKEKRHNHGQFHKNS